MDLRQIPGILRKHEALEGRLINRSRCQAEINNTLKNYVVTTDFKTM